MLRKLKKKYKLDVLSNSKASSKLSIACEKLKKVLSANPSGKLRIECLMNDIDVDFTMERTTFEEMSKNVLKQLALPVNQALESTKLSPNQIKTVQLIGGGSYIPFIKETVSKLFETTCSTTINAVESVARGCGISAAMLSNKFALAKKFEITDAIYYPVDFGWLSNSSMETEEEINKTKNIFKHDDPSPNAKLLTFKKKGRF